MSQLQEGSAAKVKRVIPLVSEKNHKSNIEMKPHSKDAHHKLMNSQFLSDHFISARVNSLGNANTANEDLNILYIHQIKS